MVSWVDVLVRKAINVNGWFGITATRLLQLLCYCSFCSRRSSHLSLASNTPSCNGRTRRKDQRTKGRERTRFASALHPSAQRAIQFHLTATKRLFKNASPWDPLRAIL
ncbi:hypothetical protein TRIATDRAFT_159167 [Trichoderma atroviride IMI 206040]|uniref:Uncharacterized protein n=1 Tax=Hypocrea atroviridis (strain ATCC 20476 / IMI 206040) TaxID=452589 RepID=G9NTQ2_HYPAI|nr:uncharacterized protein TRIATDRAFT_159167 [Trichoderma atroviride IMI 206040]EHK46092.1 hypothetical protein TRIATDRAFT_159167 [Trichoderma atroviride IMI 206040]